MAGLDPAIHVFRRLEDTDARHKAGMTMRFSVAFQTVSTSFPERLISGYKTFATQRLPTEQSRYRELSERGQSPEVLVIGCCDSRVSPEVIFDAEPGELFVVRNVANIVPPYAPDGAAHGVSAALEFGVQVLRVKHIVVLGHAQCGGIRALAQDSAPLSPGDFIGRWMSLLTPTLEATPRATGEAEQDFLTRLEKAAVRRSLDNLMTFPCISILANRGSLALHGAYFGVAKGSLAVLDKTSDEFRAVNGAG
jgi:carbonic anhydrase